jgi:lysine 2,3-aminomutase
MFQCDPSEGTDHLRTSIEESLSIQRELWGRMSGLAMPNLSLDIPDGGGKVGLVPDYQLEKLESGRLYRGWDGLTAFYENPDEHLHTLPQDFENYLSEWDEIKTQRYGLMKNVLSKAVPVFGAEVASPLLEPEPNQ